MKFKTLENLRHSYSPVYIIVAVPGSGKSWVCEQLSDKFNHVAHDDYGKAEPYVQALIKASKDGKKPVLAETPFSISKLKTPLENHKIKVYTVFIIEEPETLASRYKERGKALPKGNLTRLETYKKRAKETGSFSGTSQEVLDYLKDI